MICIDVSNMLFHEDLFAKDTIQEGIIDINLLIIPMIGNNKSKDDSEWFVNEVEYLKEVYAWLLLKAFSHKSSFVALDRPIKIKFDPEDPFVINNAC